MGCAAPHPFHWADLRKCPKDEVLKKQGARLAENGYEVKFLNALYLVDLSAETITEISPKPGRELTEEFQILLIRYLSSEHSGSPTGKLVSEKDFPNGITFFQGPHALRVSPIVEKYGHDPAAFEARGKELGADRAEFGDISMRFWPFPEIPITYLLWKADEEFPASVSVLFDVSIGEWFTFDMIFTVVWVLTDRIVAKDVPVTCG